MNAKYSVLLVVAFLMNSFHLIDAASAPIFEFDMDSVPLNCSKSLYIGLFLKYGKPTAITNKLIEWQLSPKNKVTILNCQ